MDADGLAIGIELFAGIGDMEWLAAAEGCPEEHAAATSASTPMPTAARTAEPGRQRPGDAGLDMNQPPRMPRRRQARSDGFDDACLRRPGGDIDCNIHPRNGDE